MSTQPLLFVRHLSLAFGEIVAIDDLSFIAGKGEVTALLGPPGSGKSSVLDCISGLIRPQVGRIELHARTPAPFLLERMEHCRIAREARVVRTFRNPPLFAAMTVLENMLVAQNVRASATGFLLGMFALSRRRAKRASERGRYWLDRLGLSHAAGRMAGDLPPGLQRRLEIARALATEPRLLCLDEPDNGLNDRERDQLCGQLLELKREGLAMLITGQDFGVAATLCDRVIALDHGACIAEGTPRDVCGQPAVLRAWLGVPHGREIVPRLAVSC